MGASEYKNIIISKAKLLNYLLSESHAIGKHKARFFRSIGFHENNTKVLKSELYKIARTGIVRNRVETKHGKKLIIDGELNAPNGQHVAIRTVWIIEKGKKSLRFVTAYPT